MSQLKLDFDQSANQRARKAKKNQDQLTLFAAWAPNVDISLHSPTEAVAFISGKETEETADWLKSILGSTRSLNRRRVAFPISRLGKIAWVRPPAKITLDAATHAIASAQHAHALGFKPLKVMKEGRRVTASSPRGWPAGFRVKDAPWNAIEALINTDLPLSIDKDAEEAVAKRLDRKGAKLAKAALSGNSILIETGRPNILEAKEIPGMSYVGEFGDGTYRLPLLLGKPLLEDSTIEVYQKAAQAIKRSAKKPKPLIIEDEDFPWTLWDFQAVDAGRGKQILQTTGGVLLAGGMGSGKTTVSLGIAHAMDLFPIIAVSPLSAMSTWQRQLGEMGKDFYMATNSPKKDWEELQKKDYDAYVISFDRVEAFAEILREKNCRGIIADELQRIKNPGSKRSRALRSIASSVPYRIGLSGTPLVGGLQDLLSQFAFLIPSEFPARAAKKTLEDRYPGDPVDAMTEHLHASMVRRKISDVGRPLPSREDLRVYVQLTPEQRAALTALEEEAERDKEEGQFAEENKGAKMNALVKLQRMRQIIANPRSAGVQGPNPKLNAGLKVAKQFINEGRQGVIFVADRPSFVDMGEMLDKEGISWAGIWGSSSADERIEAENKLHRGDVKIVMCTIQAGAESWSATPEGTFAVFCSYTYTATQLEQAEARVHRLNSDLEGPPIKIVYMHATDPSVDQSPDDRVVEILNFKKELAARVVDREEFEDSTLVQNSLSDLMYMLTGEKDEKLEAREKEDEAAAEEKKRQKEHAKETIHRKKV